jgi:hypothetical protein
MSRYKGTFIFGANFEGGSTVPIDARQLVCTYADLTLPSTWCFSPVCSSMALYDGMLTVVASGACSGAYWLCDWTDYTNPNSWVRIGAGGGTLSGACNGLHTINSGTTVVLGGTLLSGTTILNPSYSLLLSGATNSSVCSVVQGPYILPFILPEYQQTFICQTYDSVTLQTFRLDCGKVGRISVGVISGATSGVLIYGTGADSTYGDILLWGATYGTSISGACTNFYTPIKIFTGLTNGSTCDALLMWDSGDKLVKKIAVSAITSGITGTITGGTNGLGYINQDVCLGGILNNSTIINTGGYNLTFSGETGSTLMLYTCNPSIVTYGCIAITDNCVSLERQVGVNCAYIDFTGTTITTCAKNGNLYFDAYNNGAGGCIFINSSACVKITAPSGATYAGCYHNNYTNRTLVDKEYVDKKRNILCVCCTTSFPYYITEEIGFLGISGASTSDWIYLPPIPITKGYQVTVADICGNALAVPICVISQCGICIANNGCAVINTDYGVITFLYNGLSWSPIAFVN